MKLQESGENYLETILIEQKRLVRIRSIDIVNSMGYSKATISVAMKQLRENGFIEMDGEGYITLTGAGRVIAEKVYERHQVIASLLMTIGVSEKTAFQDACRVEHYISDETFDCIKRVLHRDEK